MFEFKHEEIRTWVRSLAQVLQTNLAVEVDVLSRFCASERLGHTNAVLQFKDRDACVVFNCVPGRWVEQNGVW